MAEVPRFDQPTSGKRVVFILGSPRSGTSSMLHTLKRYFGYAGDLEGHVLTLCHAMTQLAEQHFFEFGDSGDAQLNTLSRLGRQRVLRAITDMTRTFIETSDDGEKWVDKTPGNAAILALRETLAAFPSAKFIYLVRDGKANVESRLRKFPDSSFEHHCGQWAENVLLWIANRDRIAPENRLEIHLESLADAKATLATLATFLGEAVPAPVPDQLPMIEMTSNAGTQSLWTDQRRRHFDLVCGGAMTAIGYSAAAPGLSRPMGVRRVVLPPPYGQLDVVSCAESAHYVGFKSDDDGVWIFLHPGAAPAPFTSVTYRNVNLTNTRQFSATAKVESALSGPIEFSVEAKRPGAITVAFAATITVPPATSVRWLKRAVELEGVYDISLRTRMANGLANTCAWAFVLNPSFS